MTYNIEILPMAWEDLKRIEDWRLQKAIIHLTLRRNPYDYGRDKK